MVNNKIMKKLLFFIILAGVAYKLKAQDKTFKNPFDKDNYKDGFSVKPVYPKSFINPEALTKTKENLIAGNTVTYAEVDKMPIVKSAGKWNMPVVKPSGNYNMPIIGLPPVVKKDSALLKP